MRQSAAAARIRQHRWGGQPWRWGSVARRLWLRTRHTAGFIADLIHRQDIDLVHLNDALPLAEPGILAAWRCRRPSVVAIRSFTPIDDFHRLISRLPAAAVFTSRSLQEQQRVAGARFRREVVIPNAVDLSAYAQSPDRVGVRAEFGLPPDARIAVVVGRIMRRKGIDHFVRALARATVEFPTLHGLVIGEVERGQEGVDAELRDIAASLGISDHLHFTGYRDDIPRLLQASDLLSFVPSTPEPFGRTLIEAMAAGLPVIGAGSGAIPDIVVDGMTGLLIPPGDALAQANAMTASCATLPSPPPWARPDANAPPTTSASAPRSPTSSASTIACSSYANPQSAIRNPKSTPPSARLLRPHVRLDGRRSRTLSRQPG